MFNKKESLMMTIRVK